MSFNFPARPQAGDILIGATGARSAYGRIVGVQNIFVEYGEGSCIINSLGSSIESMPFTAGQVQTIGTATQTIALLSPNVSVVNAGWGQGQLIGVDNADASYVRGGAYYFSWRVTGGVPQVVALSTDSAYIWDVLVVGVGDTNNAISAVVVGSVIEIRVTGLSGRTMDWATHMQYFEVHK